MPTATLLCPNNWGSTAAPGCRVQRPRRTPSARRCFQRGRWKPHAKRVRSRPPLRIPTGWTHSLPLPPALAGLCFAKFLSPFPKRLKSNHSAQGCDAGATLGSRLNTFELRSSARWLGAVGDWRGRGTRGWRVGDEGEDFGVADKTVPGLEAEVALQDREWRAGELSGG